MAKSTTAKKALPKPAKPAPKQVKQAKSQSGKAEKPKADSKPSAVALLTQKHLPGMEPVKDEAVHAAAVEYAKVRDARNNLTKKEKDAELNLIAIMHEKKIKLYSYNGVTVNLMNMEKPKVIIAAEKKKKEDEES